MAPLPSSSLPVSASYLPDTNWNTSAMESSKDPHSVPNRGPELVAVNLTFTVAALIANMLRCYVRMAMVKAFGLDDWLMSLATVTVPSITSI
jgi:hypothetical protein